MKVIVGIEWKKREMKDGFNHRQLFDGEDSFQLIYEEIKQPESKKQEKKDENTLPLFPELG